MISSSISTQKCVVFMSLALMLKTDSTKQGILKVHHKKHFTLCTTLKIDFATEHVKLYLECKSSKIESCKTVDNGCVLKHLKCQG